MLSRTAEHGLRALIYLARHADAGYVSARAIAAALGAPGNYLSKVLRTLSRAGLVDSTRGPQGGFRLAMPAHEISLAVISAVLEEPAGAGRCLLGDHPCDPSNPCAAHRRWEAVRARAAETLASTTVADLLGGDA